MNREFIESEKRLYEFMGIRFPYQRPRSEWQRTNPEKILSLSDPHTPFDNEKVYSICEQKHRDAHLVVVPGDLADYYSKSRFVKTRVVKFSEELRAVFFRIEWLATHWKSVKIMLGNHDNRPEKSLANVLSKDTDLLLLMQANLLTRLAAPFDNVEIVGTQLDGTDITLTHIWQLGDIIFTHAERSMTQKSALLGNISQHLFRWSKALKLKPYKVICQGHNHFSLKMTMGQETWFLLPTAANPKSIAFEYIYSSRMVGDPAGVGFTIFFQNKGETDTNASNNYLI